jgi:hypothetical protein
MNNSYPLLKFKEPCETPADSLSPWPKYDFALGYWVDKDGKPFVHSLIDHSESTLFAQTTKTATREGSDQSESLHGQSTVTRTRESSDQSESAFGQTIATKARESSDQSDLDSLIGGRTLTTETREGTDRSEHSSW